MGEAAIRIVKAAGYHTVATVEFLLDKMSSNIFFISSFSN